MSGNRPRISTGESTACGEWQLNGLQSKTLTDGSWPVSDGRRREDLAQFAMVKATRKLEAPQPKEPIIETSTAITARQPWNKGKLVGQKTPLKLKEIWAIRIRLQIASRCRDLALFNLAVDSKLRACDFMQLRVRDVCHGQSMASRALILQQKTSRPVQFEITEPARTAVSAWITLSKLKAEDYLFPSRIHASPHLSTRQYARIVDSWVLQLGLDPSNYGTHTLRRTKAPLIYRRTKNLRAVQLLLGHTKLESTVRYLGIEVDDALEMAEQTEA
jgi:integrase